MSPAFRLRPEAQADLEDAAFWYDEQKTGLGDVFVGELFDLLQRTAESPLHFPVMIAPVRRALLHRFPFAVYFVPEDGITVILAVLHQHRDPAIWKGRL